MIESTENIDLIMKCKINWEQSLVTYLQVILFKTIIHWPWALAAVLSTKSRPTTKR